MNPERLSRHLYRRVYSDRHVLESRRPAEYKLLSDLVSSARPSVRLVEGEEVVLDREDLVRLWNDLPWYLRPFLRVPWLFIYRRLGGLGVYRLVGPDSWAARAIGYLLDGSIASARWELKPSEIEKLLSKYRSIIMVSLEFSL